MDRKSLKLYAITDGRWSIEGNDLAEKVRQAIIGGASIIQYREKTLTGDALKSEALLLQEVCKEYKVPFIINDNVDLALEIDADGVHLGADDMEISAARKLLGPDKIIGATAKTIAQAKAAEAAGADYLGSGAIFGTNTKSDAKPMSIETLAEIAASVTIPVVAIGGINAENAKNLAGLPIAGAAVVSGIFGEANPAKAAARIHSNLYGMPIIHCITNFVTANDVANIIIASGGSPIMAHHPVEVAEVQSKADALLLNLGAIEDFEVMKIAAKTANKLGHPVVVDPVGVAGIDYRRKLFFKLAEECKITCVKGNFAEIKALYEDASKSKGLDSDGESMDESIVSALARKLDCIVVATGETDLISDGNALYKVDAGHPLMREITGSGCMLSACIATRLAFSTSSAKLIADTCKIVEDRAVVAAERTLSTGAGPMKFKENWIDEIFFIR